MFLSITFVVVVDLSDLVNLVSSKVQVFAQSPNREDECRERSIYKHEYSDISCY